MSHGARHHTPAVIVRSAVASDAAALSALAQRAKAHWGYPPDWLEAWRPVLTISAEYLVRHMVLVAESADGAIGFAAVRDAGDHWELEHLWVEPSSQGKGVGRALLARVSEEVLWSRPMRLRIESDPHAVGFYERCGARRVGTVEAPVCGMARELPVLELDPARAARTVPDRTLGNGASSIQQGRSG